MKYFWPIRALKKTSFYLYQIGLKRTLNMSSTSAQLIEIAMRVGDNGHEHDLSLMRSLLDKGADPNNQNMLGRTALMETARHGYVYSFSMMRLLLESRADPNKQDCDGMTALMITLRYQGEDAELMTRLLLDKGADVNIRDTIWGSTALMYATLEGGDTGLSTMRLLLSKGAEVNVQDKQRRTALMLAVGENNEDMVRLLITYGARYVPDANLESLASPVLAEYIEGSKNWTPLHRAADARDAEAIRKCLLQGTTCSKTAVDSIHQDMRTALEIAESDSYPTAQPVCQECIALLRPPLVKSVLPSGGGGGGGRCHKEDDQDTEIANLEARLAEVKKQRIEKLKAEIARLEASDDLFEV